MVAVCAPLVVWRPNGEGRRYVRKDVGLLPGAIVLLLVLTASDAGFAATSASEVLDNILNFLSYYRALLIPVLLWLVWAFFESRQAERTEKERISNAASPSVLHPRTQEALAELPRQDQAVVAPANRRQTERRPAAMSEVLAMPVNVTRFELLSYCALGLGFISLIIEYPDIARDAGDAAWQIPLFLAAFVPIPVLMIWLVARRRKNWARWLWLIMVLIGFPLSIPVISDELTTKPLLGAITIFQYLLWAVAVYLVFTGDAAKWFERRRPHSPAE
jgi:hypothetical protein